MARNIKTIQLQENDKALFDKVKAHLEKEVGTPLTNAQTIAVIATRLGVKTRKRAA